MNEWIFIKEFYAPYIAAVLFFVWLYFMLNIFVPFVCSRKKFVRFMFMCGDKTEKFWDMYG